MLIGGLWAPTAYQKGGTMAIKEVKPGEEVEQVGNPKTMLYHLDRPARVFDLEEDKAEIKKLGYLPIDDIRKSDDKPLTKEEMELLVAGTLGATRRAEAKRIEDAEFAEEKEKHERALLRTAVGKTGKEEIKK